MTILNEFKNGNLPFVLFKTPETEPERLKELQTEYVCFCSELIAYEAEENGAMFQHIIPSPEMKYTQSSSGSGVELEIHTEQAFSKLRPDILSLACVRGNKSAITYILPLKSIIDNVTCEEYQLLQQPLWMCGVDLSFRVGGFDFVEGETRGPMSIISEKEKLNYDYDLMSGLTPEATELHAKIKRIYEEHRIGINLEQ
jgi:L-asparagine oxygenase